MQRYGGVSRYYFELISRLGGTKECTVSPVIPLHINGYVPRDSAVWGASVKLTRSNFLVSAVAKALVSATNIVSAGIDIYHPTYYSRLVAPPGAKTVITVFDLIHEKFPQYFPNDRITVQKKTRIIQACDHIICISEATKRDLIEIYDVEDRKIDVVYLGITASAKLRASEIGVKPFILYVGARGGYKNFERFIRAFARVPELRRNFDIRCFGGGGFSAKEQEIIATANLEYGRVVAVQGGDSCLWELYSKAALLVYPSIYEGFGLPPLEAMSAGCPVACSKGGSLAEVVDKGAELFDPYNEDEMSHAMSVVALSTERAEELRIEGRARAAQFTWDRCAAETLSCYRRAVR